MGKLPDEFGRNATGMAMTTPGTFTIDNIQPFKISVSKLTFTARKGDRILARSLA